MTYYYRRDYVASSSFYVHPIQAIAVPGSAREEIRKERLRREFTHVLMNWSEWNRLGSSYYRNLWSEEGRMTVGNFLAGRPPLYADGLVSIYDLERMIREP